MESIGSYAFADVEDKVQELKKKGIQPIDFGVGDPTAPTPKFIRDIAKKAIDDRKSSGYPSYIGSLEFRQSVSQWSENRYGIRLNPETEISSTLGSKEAVFNFHEGLINSGDIVLCPTPGYPPYTRGAIFAEGLSYQVPLRKSNEFLIDFDEIPEKIARRAKLLWLNYPNSPTGALASADFYREAIRFAEQNDIVIASDEAYSEIYFGDSPPPSILNYGRRNIIVFNSFSKRSAMTGYRVGWVMGDPNLISMFRKVKTNIDSGTPTFLQDCAIAALSDEEHVKTFRESYLQKRDILCDALIGLGLEDCTPPSSIYLWQKVPNGLTSLEFATRLLDEKIAVVTTPGPWISEKTSSEEDPGEGYVRFAFVPPVGEVKKAAKRLKIFLTF